MANKTMKRPARRPTKKSAPTARAGKNGPFDIWSNVEGEQYIAPWIVTWLLLPAAGLIARRLWGDIPAANLLIGGIGAVLAGAAWHEAAPRKFWTRLRVTITVAWIFLRITGTCLMGGTGDWAIDRPWADILFGLGGVLALWWTIGALPAVRGDGTDHHEGPDSMAEALSLGKTTAHGIKDDETRRTFKMKLNGATMDAARSATDLMEITAGAPRGGIRMVQTNPNDASEVDVTIMKKDVLAQPTDWPGPSRPGTSIDEPLRYGLREDGTFLEDRRLQRHALIAGMNGSGKTEGKLVEASEMMTRYDVVILWADTVKPGQTLPDFAPAICKVATKSVDARRMVLALKAAITYRAEALPGRGWTPDCGMPAINITIEEAAWVAEFLGEDLMQLAMAARSVGIFIDLIFQRPSHGVLDTDTRAQFPVGHCFGVRNSTDADMVLSESTTQAGARPELWMSNRQGYCYRECGPEEKHAMPARTYRLSPARLREHVAEWAHRMAVMDEGTAEAMGDYWTSLKSGADYALEHGWTRTGEGMWVPPAAESARARPPRPTTKTSTTGTSPVEGTDNTEEGLDMKNARDIARQEAQEEIDSDHGVDPDLDQAITAASAMTDDQVDTSSYPASEDFALEPGTPGPELTREERVEAFAGVLAGLLDDRPSGLTIATRDLVDAWYEVPGITSKQRPAMYHLLRVLSDAGQVTDEGRGRWHITATAPAWLLNTLLPDTSALDDEDTEDAQDESEQPPGPPPPDSQA